MKIAVYGIGSKCCELMMFLEHHKEVETVCFVQTKKKLILS